MCLGVPGKVIEIYDTDGLKMGKVSYGGSINNVCLEYIPEVKVGQYTIVHAGFAISIVNEEDAFKSYQAWQELSEAAASGGTDVFGEPIERNGTP